MFRLVKWVVILGIIAAAITGYFWMQGNKPIPVDMVTLSRGEVQRTVTNTRAGTLNACRRARLSPSFGGQISNLPVIEGQQVKKGQLLFEIWNTDLRAQLDLVEAELNASQSLQKQACIQSDLSRREANRLDKLKDRGLISEESREKALGQALSAEAACEATKASSRVSEARIAVAQSALEKTRLTAPFDGTIAQVNGELGEYITPSPVGVQTTPAIDIIDTSCLFVSDPIDEVDAPKIKAGMVARISLDAFDAEFFEGRVRRVAPYVLDLEKQARTVDIAVDFLSDKDNTHMLPGYTADFEIVLDSNSDTLRIPTEALLEGNKVYLYDNTFSTIQRVKVETGLSNWKHTEVKSGLEVGQQVVISVNKPGLENGVSVSINKP